MGKSARICVISSIVLYIKTNIYPQLFGNQFIDAFFDRVDFNTLEYIVGKGLSQKTTGFFYRNAACLLKLLVPAKKNAEFVVSRVGAQGFTGGGLVAVKGWHIQGICKRGSYPGGFRELWV